MNSNPLLFYLSQIFLSILAQVSVEQIFSSFKFFFVFTAFTNVNANVNHVIIIIENKFFTFSVWNKEKITNKKLKLPCHSIQFFLISNITLFSFSYVKAKMLLHFLQKLALPSGQIGCKQKWKFIFRIFLHRIFNVVLVLSSTFARKTNCFPSKHQRCFKKNNFSYFEIHIFKLKLLNTLKGIN